MFPYCRQRNLKDTDLIGRCGLACGVDGLSIPCWSSGDWIPLLASKYVLTPISFACWMCDCSGRNWMR